MEGDIEIDDKKSGVGMEGKYAFTHNDRGIILIGGKNIKDGKYNCMDLKVAEDWGKLI